MSNARRFARRVELVLRIWWLWLSAELALRRRPLPEVVARMGREPWRKRGWRPPTSLGWTVWRALRFGRYRPRCLLRTLVHYRLLAQQGTPAELIIGLPARAAGKEAHAWLEVSGVDVGPPPGRHGHVPFARYR